VRVSSYVKDTIDIPGQRGPPVAWFGLSTTVMASRCTATQRPAVGFVALPQVATLVAWREHRH